MQIVGSRNSRRARLVLMGLLIIFSALAGYHWGNILEEGGIYGHDVLIAAACFTVLAVIVAFAVEAAVTRTEAEAAAAQVEEEKKAEESNISREQARELDRIVSRLSQDNSDLRYQLMSVRLHELGQEMALAKPAKTTAPPVWRTRTS